MFRRKKQAEELLPPEQDAGAAAAAMDDRTDPLSPAEPFEERVALIVQRAAASLERVEVWGDGAISRRFLRLRISGDAALAQSLRGLLLEAAESMTGFDGLLEDSGCELAAAFDLPGAYLSDFLRPTGLGPEVVLRPLDALDGIRDLAAFLALAHERYGLGLSEVAAHRIGLTQVPVGKAAGLASWRFTFTAWESLDKGAPDAGPALRDLLVVCLAHLRQGAELEGLRFSPLELGKLEARLAQYAAGTDVTCAGLAAWLGELRCGFTAHAATDSGRRREHNEDAYLLVQHRQASLAGSELLLAAVADGMGGHASGEVASSLALDLLRQQLVTALLAPRTTQRDPEALPEQLRTLIPAIGRVLAERAQLDPALGGMGTTLCGLAVLRASTTVTVPQAAVPADINRVQPGPPAPPPECAALFSVGDSRAYLIGPGGLRQLSHDHSYVQDLVDSGSIDAAEAFDHPKKNIVTRCLGGGGSDSTPDVLAFTPGIGEIVLLCSDGLSDALRDEDIWRVICEARSADFSVLCRALIDAANAAGGPDNITLVLLGCTAG